MDENGTKIDFAIGLDHEDKHRISIRYEGKPWLASLKSHEDFDSAREELQVLTDEIGRMVNVILSEELKDLGIEAVVSVDIEEGQKHANTDN